MILRSDVRTAGKAHIIIIIILAFWRWRVFLWRKQKRAWHLRVEVRQSPEGAAQHPSGRLLVQRAAQCHLQPRTPTTPPTPQQILRGLPRPSHAERLPCSCWGWT